MRGARPFLDTPQVACYKPTAFPEITRREPPMSAAYIPIALFVVVATGFAIFLGAGLAATLVAVLDAGLVAALGFTAALLLLTITFAAILALLAGLFALADFADLSGFAFTACLL